MDMIITHSDFQYTFDRLNKIKSHLVARKEWRSFEKGQVLFSSLEGGGVGGSSTSSSHWVSLSCFKKLKDYPPGRFFWPTVFLLAGCDGLSFVAQKKK